MKVLYLIRTYKTTDGSSMALHRLITNNPQLTDYIILCRRIISKQEDLNIQTVDSWKDIEKIVSNNRFDVIHYFKNYGFEMFNWTIKALLKQRLNIPVVTTVCQRPSYPGLLLSPNEIKYSKKIVFIDKTAFSDPLLRFLGSKHKQLIYFGVTPDVISKTEKILNSPPKKSPEDPIIFGRGSTLNKCPSNIIEIFDKIKVKNKKFIIAGIPENSWLEPLVKNRTDIELIPPTSFEKWLEICNTFDIFLYHLPMDCHSSIDGTLGNAMILKKAVAYLGPEAPKERFSHNKNALVANNEDELITYATELGNNPQLRQKIGEEARKSTINDFTIESCVKKYNELYLSLSQKCSTPIMIPFKYHTAFIKSCWVRIIKSKLAGSFIEKAHFKAHPIK